MEIVLSGILSPESNRLIEAESEVPAGIHCHVEQSAKQGIIYEVKVTINISQYP